MHHYDISPAWVPERAGPGGTGRATSTEFENYLWTLTQVPAYVRRPPSNPPGLDRQRGAAAACMYLGPRPPTHSDGARELQLPNA